MSVSFLDTSRYLDTGTKPSQSMQRLGGTVPSPTEGGGGGVGEGGRRKACLLNYILTCCGGVVGGLGVVD